MKIIIRKFWKAAFIIHLSFLFLVYAYAQTNYINISSSQQTVNPTTTYNPWKVTNMSNGMANAVCYGNSIDGWSCPFGGTSLSPVNINDNAKTITTYFAWPSGYYLSCFPANTILAPRASQDNSTNLTMTISRYFYVYSNKNEDVSFDFTVNCDNFINSIMIDGNTVNAIDIPFTQDQEQSTLKTQINIVKNLAPGLHSIDITCDNYENADGGRYCFIQGIEMQLNPFGIAIAGNITATTNVIVNGDPPTDDPVPVKLSQFAGSANQQTVTLSWVTENEINTHSIIIERSLNGITFNPIVTVPAKGNSTAKISYSYIDNTIPITSANVFYRLKFVDRDQKITFSNIISLPLYAYISQIKISPNPAKDYVQLTIPSKTRSVATIRIADFSGKTLIVQKATLNNGVNSITINKLQKLAAGMYMIIVTHDGETKTERLLIKK